MNDNLRQRLAKEYRYAVTKMQETSDGPKKLYYFSVFFGESQRVLNFEWDQSLALVNIVTQQVYAQISSNADKVGILFPVKAGTILEPLTQASSDLAAYFEKPENDASQEELCQILGRLAEISYASSGNGSYLYEKGAIKL